jgi:hypothetical protein
MLGKIVMEPSLRDINNDPIYVCYIIRMMKSRRMRWAGHVARMGETRNANRILVGKPEGKKPLGSPRRRWLENIEIDLREIG